MAQLTDVPYENRGYPEIRKRLDPIYEADLSALQAAYADWKQDVSHPWRGYDKGVDIATSREIYVDCCSMLWGWYAKAAGVLARANLQFFDDIQERQQFLDKIESDEGALDRHAAKGQTIDFTDLVVL